MKNMKKKSVKKDKDMKGYMEGGRVVEIPMPGSSGPSTMRGMGAATKGGRFSGVK